MGVPFTLDVDLSNFSGDGSTPAIRLNNYTFDLLFNPKVFEATQAQVGTIFGPNDGIHGAYIPGTINAESGLPGSDVDVGTLPTSILSVRAATTVPEPASGGLLILGAGTAWAFLRVRSKTRGSRFASRSGKF